MCNISYYQIFHAIFCNISYFFSMPNIKDITETDIKNFRKQNGLTQTQLSDLVGVTLRTIQNWEDGKVIPSTKMKKLKLVLSKSYETPINFSKNIVAEGQEIYLNKKGNKFSKIDGEIMVEVPLLLFEAYAKYLDVYSDAKVFNSDGQVGFVIDKLDTSAYYLGFRISGDSMSDGTETGTPHRAIVLGKEIPRTDWIDGGLKDSVYGWIILTNKNILFKDITAIDKSLGIITCHSRNPSPEYADFELPLNNVYQIFKVIKRAF